MTKVKICGLQTTEDIQIINQYKPDYAGAILSPGFSRSISHARAKELRRTLDPTIPLVGVFVDCELAFMRSFFEEGIIDIAQFHGQEDDHMIRALKEAVGKPVWKAFQMETAPDIKAIESNPADRVLLDAGKGSGQTFDWSVTGEVKRSFMLAGGLTPVNVSRAIKSVHPYGVDVSSGVETDGKKDEEKVRDFIRHARSH